MASPFAVVKVSGGGNWWDTSVTVDGKALPVQSVSFTVGIDKPGVLTLEVEEHAVEVDMAGVYEPVGPPEHLLTICEDCSGLLAAKHAELKES